MEAVLRSTSKPWRLAALSLFVLAALGVPRRALAQDVTYPDEKTIALQFDEVEGTPLEDFISLCMIQTGLQFTYTGTEVKDVKLRFIGKKTLNRDQFWAYFQAVLTANDFVIVPYGNVPAPGRPTDGPDSGFFRITKSSGAGTAAKPGFIKTRAPVVTPEQLASFRYDAGVVLTTSFSMKYVNAQEAMNMLQSYFTDPLLESVRAVTNSNSLVVTGYAQTLYGIKQLIDLIDVKPTEFEPKFAKVQLEFAVAEEIKPILDQLVAADRGQATNRPGTVPQANNSGLPANLQEPEPVIEADPRTNSLLVIAAQKSLDKIIHFIRTLDTEVDPRGDTHVYRLKNSAAKDLEEVLSDWAQNSGAGSSSGGTRSGANGAAGGAGTAGNSGSLEQPITVVADEASNSLIITASKSRYAQILEIVKKLDERRRQVLIETALVEISGTLNDQLGVELGYVSVAKNPDNDTNRGFGVTQFGLSQLKDTNDDGIVDTRIPIGIAPDQSGNVGITAGIFSGKDFAIPVVLSALKRTTDVNVLSQPSVLVNDNEEAIIRTIDEVPTFTISQGVNSDQQSFNDFVEAGITLNISPSISAGNYLRLLVKLEVSAFTDPSGNPPPKSTREVETSVTLPDSHTMVIGGIVQDDQRHSESKTPWLGELPLFGWLFRNTTENDTRTNLYVFLTPHIISDDFATLDELSYLKKQEMEKLNGKIYLVDPDWDRDNADTRVLDAGTAGVFDLPSYASPPGGEVETTKPKPAEPYQFGEQPATTGPNAAPPAGTPPTPQPEGQKP